MNLPEKRYTEQEVARATSASHVKGWLEGAGTVVGGVILLKFLGWIPALIGVVAVAWVLYKLLAKPDRESS